MPKRKADPFRSWLQSRMMSGRAVGTLALLLDVSGATLYNWRKGGGVDLRTAPLVIALAAKDSVTLTTDHLLPRPK